MNEYGVNHTKLIYAESESEARKIHDAFYGTPIYDIRLLVVKKKVVPCDKAYAIKGLASSTPISIAHKVSPASATFKSKQVNNSQPYLEIFTSHI